MANRRKSSMSKRAAVKRSTQGGFLDACTSGNRWVAKRHNWIIVPRNNVKTDCKKSGSRLLREAAHRAEQWHKHKIGWI